MELNAFLKKLGKRIKREREALGLRQSDFEDHSPNSIDPRNIRAIEAGEANITMATLLKVCATLKTTPSKLLDF